MAEQTNNNVLVIGAGVAGIEASLLLAEAGKKVYLVEKEPLFGGQVIKYEEVFPNMECSTCMIAPKQQDVLQNPDIELLTLTEVQEVKGEAGNFSVLLKRNPRYVSEVNCIGCGACYEPCPVSLDNEFEENLIQKKAIYIPCSGALPNVPVIDPHYCTRLSGKDDCQACKDSCMFEAIEYDQKEEYMEIKVEGIIVATGASVCDLKELSQYAFGKVQNVYSALEFERLFAKNGPTEGAVTLRDGSTPESVAIVHCVGRKELGYCSAVCCMYAVKFAHYLKHCLPKAKVSHLYYDLCVPGKSYQKFHKKAVDEGAKFIYAGDVSVSGNGNKVTINYKNDSNKEESLEADMVILAQSIKNGKDTESLAKILGISQDNYGFFLSREDDLEPVATDKPGIFVVGTAESPKDVPDSIAQAQAAVGKVLSIS
ncbi:CoB--CoM heterodisulfide reductase iron-sulfur subunit A family protein [bacterium]|nr:CoB--CoM heterodisulfide reductase iron-sulfur subunit A family protein [bacterium]